MARRKDMDKVQAALAVAALAQLDREKNAPAPPAAPPTDAETLQAVMTTPAPVEAPAGHRRSSEPATGSSAIAGGTAAAPAATARACAPAGIEPGAAPRPQAAAGLATH